MSAHWGQEPGKQSQESLEEPKGLAELINLQLPTAATAHPGELILQHFSGQKKRLGSQKKTPRHIYWLANLQSDSNLVFTTTVR